MYKTVEQLLADFNRYFTSSNNVDVPARISVPRDELRDVLARVQTSIAERDVALAKLAVTINYLNEIASWESGAKVTSRFDEPGSASAAREALAEIGHLSGYNRQEL